MKLTINTHSNTYRLSPTMLRIPESPPHIEAVPASTDRPLWSVMIPVYNCIDYIPAVLESVLMQDAGSEHMQIEVIDDCSTDGNVEGLVRRIGKGRIGYYRQSVNKGSLRNFETCINRAKGRYVHLLHGDDFVSPGFYKTIGSLFNNYPTAGAAFTNFAFVDHKGKNLEIKNEPLRSEPGLLDNFLPKIAGQQLIQPPAMVVRRTTYEHLGSFFAVHFGEDWEMWTRIAANYPIAYSPEYLASYRVGHGIGISQNSFMTGQNLKDISKVVTIIQNYLPEDQQKKLKKKALEYYAIYCIRIANGFLAENRSEARRQVNGALKMNSGILPLGWAIRFYVMYLTGFKRIQKRINRGSRPTKITDNN